MKMKIKDIASVQMGYPFRTRLEFSTDGTLAVIQMKDLNSDNRVDCHNVQKIDMIALDIKHLAQKGDLIFRSRGVTNTAAILDKTPKDAVVSAPLLRIRTNTDIVLPEYLCWFINQKQSQQYLKMRQEGTHGGMISRQNLEDLAVDIPPLETQEKIVDIITLHNYRQNLEKKRINMQEQKISALLLNIIRGEK
jgi:restriction endonuclease S subunit